MKLSLSRVGVAGLLGLVSAAVACDGRQPLNAAGAGAGEVDQQPPGTTGAVTCTAGFPAAVRSQWIAFDSDRAGLPQLFRAHADGTGLQRLLTDDFTDQEPAYSPDGTKLAFASDRLGGMSQIFLLDIATASVTPLTYRYEGADQPSFSRDGAEVAFHAGASVYTINVKDAGQHLVATGSDTFNAYFWPQFSADDTALVFDRNNEIDAATIGASTMRMIVQNWTVIMKAPAVSPDGKDVAYGVDCEPPGSSIWTTPYATKTDPCAGRRVTPLDPQAIAEHPAWGSNDVLAYARIDETAHVSSIALISRDAGSTPCVIVTGGNNRNPTWSGAASP